MFTLFHTVLFQNKQNRWGQALRTIVSGWILFALCAVSAQAGVTGIDTNQRKTVVYTSSFEDVGHHLSPRLDWRNPSTEMTFHIPESAWIEDLELLVSGHPVGPIKSNDALYVQFNNASPVKIFPGNHSFDARIRLDRRHIRARFNTVTFSVKDPSLMDDGQCALPRSSAWDLELTESQIIVTAKTRLRPMHMRDLKDQLMSRTLAPKTVSIRAFGPNADKSKALAAQGISLNMDHVPMFKSPGQNAQLGIILGTRDQLRSRVKDEVAFQDAGPAMVITRTHPAEIVLTGDTEAEVEEMAKAFSTYEIPPARRRKATPGEFYFRSPFSMMRKTVAGETRLTAIGNMDFGDGWGSRPQTLKFNVANPAISQGKAVIRVSAAATVDPNSQVSVVLNGRSLGFSKLDSKRKVIAFDIPRGLLKGIGNMITITPELTPIASEGDCSFARTIPGFSVHPESYLDIKTDKTASLTDLSRFSASGFPFSFADGAHTSVFLTGTQQNEDLASLRVLGQLALASGSGWTNANFVTRLEQIPDQHDIMLIGPPSRDGQSLLDKAPRSLKTAINGQRKPRQAYTRTAELVPDNAINLLSLRPQSSALMNGGVAAIFLDTESERVIGLISTSQGQSFARNVDYLLKEGHWNSLEGSVAKWDRDDVLMAQTALPEKYYRKTAPARPAEFAVWSPPRISAPAWQTPQWYRDFSFKANLHLESWGDSINDFWDRVRYPEYYNKNLSRPADRPWRADNRPYSSAQTPTQIPYESDTREPAPIYKPKISTPTPVVKPQLRQAAQTSLPQLRTQMGVSAIEPKRASQNASIFWKVSEWWNGTALRADRAISDQWRSSNGGSEGLLTLLALVLSMIAIVLSIFGARRPS